MSVPENNTVHYIIKQASNFNSSALAVLDVRTPPKIQNEIQQKLNNMKHVESSHAGIAIPIEEDLEILEASTKKMNFYKIERPTTTNGGLSTWILLSGQPASTTSKPPTKKASIKPIVVKEDANNTLVISDKPMKVIKPIFKQRTTTAKPTTTSNPNIKSTHSKINSSTITTTAKPTKLTKIKASLLNTNNSKQNNSSSDSNNTSPIAVTTNSKNTSADTATVKSTTAKMPAKTKKPTTTTTKASLISTTTVKSEALPAEPKDGEQELPNNDKKKDQKKKKNKIKKKKQDKNNNNKLKEVESAGTQLYSYLRSEIIPVTVGVSLVGLLVTAGLASYYFQPFGAFSLRRNDPQDRKDTLGGYYYQDDYSNAVREEDAFGQVIAGMDLKPHNDNYKISTRSPYQTDIRYRQVDRRSEVYMTPSPNDNRNGLASEYNHPNTYNNENKFVVGSVIKEEVQEVTPAVVPEHGPRNLKGEAQKFVVGNIPNGVATSGASPRNLRLHRRRRRQTQSEISPEQNEIINQETFDVAAIFQMKNKGIDDSNDQLSENSNTGKSSS